MPWNSQETWGKRILKIYRLLTCVLYLEVLQYDSLYIAVKERK